MYRVSPAPARIGLLRVPRRTAGGAAWLAMALVAAGCASTPRPPAYVPRERQLVVTAVPLLTKEMASVYPFLHADFARGGILDGKEVYAFMPSTFVAVEGDTLRFTFVNPEDDEHDFVLEDLVVALPGQSVTHATWRAERAGIFTFVCTVPAHTPMMYGEILVLPAAAAAGFAAPASGVAP